MHDEQVSIFREKEMSVLPKNKRLNKKNKAKLKGNVIIFIYLCIFK